MENQNHTSADPAPKVVDSDDLSLQEKYDQLKDRYIRLLEEKVQRQALAGPYPPPLIPPHSPPPPGWPYLPPGPAGAPLADGKLASVASEAGETAAGTKEDGPIKYRAKRFVEGMFVEGDYDKASPEDNKHSQSESAATFVYHFNVHHTQHDTEIRIESAAARKILQRELKHYPGYHWESQQLSIFEPFKPFIHNWDALTKAIDSDPDAEGSKDLAAILNAVKSTEAVKQHFDAKGFNEGLIVYDLLWTIFPPGEFIVFSNGFMKQKQVFIVNETWDQLTRDRKKSVVISCWSYDWDGGRRVFKRVGVEIQIDFFKGQRQITSLPCYPLKQLGAEEREDLEEKLIMRGIRFRDLCTKPRGQQLFEYDGEAFYRGTGVRQISTESPGVGSRDDMSISIYQHGGMRREPSDPEPKSGRQLKMKGRVMVDFESYSRHGPNGPIPMGDLTVSDDDDDDECRCEKCMAPGGPCDNQKYSWDYVLAEPPNDLSREQYLICPPRVLGYHLMEKKWVEMSVDCVQKIERPQVFDAFDKVQLAAPQKELIKQLVQSHSKNKDKANNSPRSKMNDLTKGKGEGLVILLHGPPGVGKTVTAEGVAQVTGKPLFPMGVGDITTDPSRVEKRLEQMFELAEVWQAVMLFDEADVFLESRAATTDVTRVGLVSVLLRVLEYYQGILILTTNRIRSFDIAVQSRINLAVQFLDLKERQKTTIFENLIDQLDEDSIENKRQIIKWFKKDDEAINLYQDLNGRQIRNVVFSAASLAGNRPAGQNLLKKEDIEGMLRETWKFQHHLAQLTKAARDKNEM